jgi:5-methylcytosine-specific restriction endonuclease McrA
MNVPEEDLFQNLEEVWTRLGRQPRYEETCKPLSRYSSGTYEKRFGTWRKALEAFVVYINSEEHSEHSSSTENEARSTEPRLVQKGPRNINWRLRFIVMRRDNFKCKTCGRSPATEPSVVLHVDHIEAWSKNGKTVLENLQTLCSICNIGKSNLDFQEAR